MAHLAITAGTNHRSALRRALARLDPGAPVIVMTHGFRYCPHDPQNDPHRLILAPVSGAADLSWPAAFGLADREGLSIGFGWSARGSIWEAYQAAECAGAALAALIAEIRALGGGRPIHLIGHSLGARVALLGLRGAPPGAVARAILIAPAVLRHEAEAIAQSPSGAGAEIVSITSRENTAFDLLLRAALPMGGATLGGGGPARASWLDLRLDCPIAERALAQMGLPLAPQRRLICHWSGYLRQGVWPLYRALLLRPDLLRLDALRARIETPRPAAAPWPLGSARA